MSYIEQLLSAIAYVAGRLFIAVPIGLASLVAFGVIAVFGSSTSILELATLIIHVLAGWSLIPLLRVPKLGVFFYLLFWVTWCASFYLYFGNGNLIKSLAVYCLATLVVGAVWVLPRTNSNRSSTTLEPSNDAPSERSGR